jgi:hypothetical protein
LLIRPVTRKYYDYADMTSARLRRYDVGSTGGLQSHRADVLLLVGVAAAKRSTLPPGEMFAVMYEACAMGMTREKVDDAGFNTYGWEPPDGSEAALCDLIRGAIGS